MTDSRPTRHARSVASMRRQRARIAAFALHSQGKTSTAAATRAFLAAFENEVDPNRELPEEERQRRALAARRGYMARLALRSVRARQRRSKSSKIRHNAR